LTDSEKKLEERGLKFVRRADGSDIRVKSRRAAERALESSARFLKGRLGLKADREKSKAGSPAKLNFLGSSLWKFGRKSGIGLREKSLARLKNKAVKATKRNRGRSMGQVLADPAERIKKGG
jgi:hypothetical protein